MHSLHMLQKTKVRACNPSQGKATFFIFYADLVNNKHLNSMTAHGEWQVTTIEEHKKLTRATRRLCWYAQVAHGSLLQEQYRKAL